MSESGAAPPDPRLPDRADAATGREPELPGLREAPREYTADDFTLIDPEDHIRRNPQLYLPHRLPWAPGLASYVAIDAIDTPGVEETVTARLGRWWLVASSADWIPASRRPNVQEWFTRWLPHPDAP